MWELLGYRESKPIVLPASDSADDDVSGPSQSTTPTNRSLPNTVSNGPPPFIKAKLQMNNEVVVFLLTAELTYSKILTEIRSALHRRCLSAENITADNPIQLTGPMGLQELIFDDEDLDNALDKLQDAIDLEMDVRESGAAAILQHEECLPSYSGSMSETVSNIPEKERRGSYVDLLEDFALRTTYNELFENGGIICLEIGLW